MRRNKYLKVILGLALLISSLLLVTGCGGGGGSGAAPAAGVGTISGTAVKGPVDGGTVTAYAVTNGTMGTQLGSGTTDSQGNYHLSIGTYSGPVMLQMSGGSFMDEATGTAMTMSPGDVMTVVMQPVTSGEAVTDIQITPLTSMAQTLANNMAGGMTAANIAAANMSVGNYFMVNDILHTHPMNPLISGSSSTATQNMRNYGMTIAAMSQSTTDMGMTSSSSIVTAMMNDASDGVMNGMMGGTPIMMGGMMAGNSLMPSTAGISGLATEMATFIASPMNKSGVTASNMQTLMNQLSSSSGTIE